MQTVMDSSLRLCGPATISFQSRVFEEFLILSHLDVRNLKFNSLSWFPASSWGSILPAIVERDTRISRVTTCSFGIGNRDILVHKGQKSYRKSPCGMLWTNAGARCIKHTS